MMTYSQALADWYSETGPHHTLASVYVDGVILYLVVTRKTQEQIEEAVERACDSFESSRSLDDFCGVMIVKPDFDKFGPEAWKLSLSVVSVVVERLGLGNLGWNDNRLADDNTIEDFVQRIMRIREGNQ